MKTEIHTQVHTFIHILRIHAYRCSTYLSMYTFTHTHTHIYIHSFIYICMYIHLYTSWIIPAYRCSKGAEKLCIMRVVRCRCEGGKQRGKYV